jgi:hypothetical protein
MREKGPGRPKLERCITFGSRRRLLRSRIQEWVQNLPVKVNDFNSDPLYLFMPRSVHEIDMDEVVPYPYRSIIQPWWPLYIVPHGVRSIIYCVVQTSQDLQSYSLIYRYIRRETRDNSGGNLAGKILALLRYLWTLKNFLRTHIWSPVASPSYVALSGRRDFGNVTPNTAYISVQSTAHAIRAIKCYT